MRVERVDNLVAVDDLARALGILGHKGVKHFTQHGLRFSAHVGNVDVGFELWLGVQLEHTLADIDAQIGDALEVGHDLQHQGDEAQVGSHGLSPGKDLQA